ncbi:MAG: hypothetical protein DRJ49_02755 [Thermoprotei archaeon]|nr:MAG: hypothetical protein DRN53_05285 [Thermoprotei archaeon]RLE89508.1 MAG: hypothetical protein DRJ49_02755 [Thermoprotei archaeon]
MEARELGGLTLEIYKILAISNKPWGVRELQRKLKVSTPSLILYHLNKLENMDLVDKTPERKYVVKRYVKVDILKYFITIGRISIPRYLFYSVFISILVVEYILNPPFIVDLHYIMGLMIGIFSAVILWYETLRMFVEYFKYSKGK